MDDRVAIGVPTHNRAAFVRLAARSLANSLDGRKAIVIVVDDCSDEYGKEFLEDCYSGATVIRRERNSGSADNAGFDLLGRLHATGRELLLVLDSDLVVASDWMARALPLMDRCDGLLSLFNTPNHAPISADGPLVEKASVGMAATIWHRDLAAEVLASVPAGNCWDMRAAEHVRTSGRRVFAVRDSLVQHLGFGSGQNSGPGRGDIGHAFHDQDTRSLYLLLEGLMYQEQAANRRIFERLKAMERVLKPALWISRKLLPLRRRIRALRNR